MTEPQKAPRRRRARKDDGKFQADNPATDVNEAWEPIEVADTLPKNDYAIKPKVKPQSNGGKYSQAPKVRPTFGKVTSTSN